MIVRPQQIVAQAGLRTVTYGKSLHLAFLGIQADRRLTRIHVIYKDTSSIMPLMNSQQI